MGSKFEPEDLPELIPGTTGWIDSVYFTPAVPFYYITGDQIYNSLVYRSILYPVRFNEIEIIAIEYFIHNWCQPDSPLLTTLGKLSRAITTP